jgi:hypothetical protein
MKINAHRLGLVLGLIIGGWHALWSLLVALGVAQWLIDFAFWAHFLTPAFHVGVFDPVRALVLVVCTAVLGYLFGFLGGLVWNALHRS